MSNPCPILTGNFSISYDGLSRSSSSDAAVVAAGVAAAVRASDDDDVECSEESRRCRLPASTAASLEDHDDTGDTGDSGKASADDGTSQSTATTAADAALESSSNHDVEQGRLVVIVAPLFLVRASATLLRQFSSRSL